MITKPLQSFLFLFVILILILIVLSPAPGCAPAQRRASTTQPSPTVKPSTRALPFAAEIEAFERSDRATPPPRGAVLFVGSSSIRLWKTLKEDFPGIPVLNRGFGGSQVADSVRYADRIVIPCRPRAIVLYAGDNDIAAGKSPERVLADFQALVEKVHATLPDTPVLYISIKPSVARWRLVDKIREANRLVEQFAAGHPHVDYVDVFTPALDADGKPRADLLVADGLHLNAMGYRVWTRIVRTKLDQVWAADE